MPENADDNDSKAEPKHLKAPNPGPCPRESGCKCNWTALDLGWIKAWNRRCPVCSS